MPKREMKFKHKLPMPNFPQRALQVKKRSIHFNCLFINFCVHTFDT